MISNFILTAARNIRRNLSYTLLNVLGLTLGIGACIIIFLVVRNELSYDQYHHKASRTYRVTLNGLDYNPTVSMGVAPHLRNDFPELEAVTQVWFQTDGLVKVGEQRYNEKQYCYADEYYTKVFDNQWLQGSRTTALSAPNSVVLTKSLAKRCYRYPEPCSSK
ncbi:hypothetical protein A4H97_08270 [Niastella yeongjuensis]|uniref:MacB-like periplasmic core domain-containing protein n=1 Tax=Niastella yeongjuensis TaxID=354355 RepID=A0A1V9EMX4_9BACT|nr:ABC transporter permease [Niastella yeongjuensis]OQP47476.1 hypothetical protein A4H97_08270 [Niastella yeongjuensis]SEN86072.1 MacB-like core domain-containing protein [Niastella yeongjuensis]